MKKSIYILYTGGTIGMAKSSGGYVPKAGLLTSLMQKMPEFSHPDMPLYTIHEYPSLIDSANIQPSHWQVIANDIQAHYDQYDAFIVLHGTDTMAYTASALSFMLKGLTKPVILTGSQVPLIEVHTDARENLMMAILIAASAKIPEVCLYFHNRLLRGNRSQKVNAFSLDAFDSPNFPPLAEVGITIQYHSEHTISASSNHDNHALTVTTLKAVKILQTSLFPGIDFKLLIPLLEEKPHAFILNTYGLGNAPATNPDLITFLSLAREKNILLINHTQCHQGSVQMASYATGDVLQHYGVLSAANMTIEAIVGKLTVLFSEHESLSVIKTAFTENLCGEL
jgi:L-asparaginase